MSFPEFNFENFKNLGGLKYCESDNIVYEFFLIAVSYILLIIFLGYNQTLALVYTMLLSVTAFIYILLVFPSRFQTTTFSGISYGDKDSLPYYLYIGIILGVVIALIVGVIVGFSNASLVFPFTVNQPSFSFNYVSTFSNVSNFIMVILTTGVFQPIIEEVAMAWLLIGVVLLLKSSLGGGKSFIVGLIVVALVFMALHVPTYAQQVSQEYNSYATQASLQSASPVNCSTGFYFNYQVNNCQPIPPQPPATITPNVNQTLNNTVNTTSLKVTSSLPTQSGPNYEFILLLMLVGVGVFRVLTSFFAVGFNSMIVAIVAHSTYNLLSLALVTLGLPIFFFLGIATFTIVFLLWALVIRNDRCFV